MTNKQDWKFTITSQTGQMFGLRKIFDYRDLGVKDGTNGDFIAHVIRRNDKGVDASLGTSMIVSFKWFMY